jgi:transcriptional regulator with XRE-family HTH domain
VNALSNLWEKLNRSKGYREAFPASVVKRMLPLQIRVLRKQREWSQAELAKESKITQGVISRAEDPEYGNLTINTLIRIAAGFDCALVARFVPFSELGRWYVGIAGENDLEVPSFIDDWGFVEALPQLGAGAATISQWTVHRTAVEQTEISEIMLTPRKQPNIALETRNKAAHYPLFSVPTPETEKYRRPALAEAR